MLDKIKELAASSQSSKGTIATYLLEHLKDIEHQSLEELAKATYTSKASLVRFAQTLGYKGWTDFLPALIAERYYSVTHYSEVDHSLPFGQDDSSSAIIQKIATIQKESIQDTADRLVPEDLEKAVVWLAKARRVVLFGLSPNEYIGHLFKRKMLALGKTIEVAHVGEFGLTTASLTKDDLAILISYSGNSSGIETLRFIPQLKEKSVPIIGLTSEQGHSLRQAADLIFTICTREDKFRKIGNFSTEESILFILNTLYALYFKSDYFAHYVHKTLLSQQLEGKR
ncbi:MurR/RpiR family transcriptional regulator [Streptococcus ovuberis]|uniref:MurR/RpiR family transcriptional regulator n=1 Tax=Streptococcus ovuberis TaxID=1936207 RepID=A0A7X6S0I0_9STRE|nr:MurR/RpiR family transcriptional regulator [Streptococcus ovuberis]NKZ20208.1 MurR/RpiR family transcriptional regulator [Streptococcus ovuberis]